MPFMLPHAYFLLRAIDMPQTLPLSLLYTRATLLHFFALLFIIVAFTIIII